MAPPVFHDASAACGAETKVICDT